MIRIREALVVEGKYDTARLRQVVDTLILETGGFRVFKNKELLSLLRGLAKERGLLVLTDSDAAGFVIRDFLSGAIPPEQLKHAYIPAIAGKEKRKSQRSKEGLLGVEGIAEETLAATLVSAGATLLDAAAFTPDSPIPAVFTKTRLFEDGLSGRPDSREKRLRFLALAGLPSYLSTNRLLSVLNTTMTEIKYREILTIIS